MSRIKEELSAEQEMLIEVRKLPGAISSLATQLAALASKQHPAPVVNVPPANLQPIMVLIQEVKTLAVKVDSLASKIPAPIKGFQVRYQNGKIDRVSVER